MRRVGRLIRSGIYEFHNNPATAAKSTAAQKPHSHRVAVQLLVLSLMVVVAVAAIAVQLWSRALRPLRMYLANDLANSVVVPVALVVCLVFREHQLFHFLLHVVVYQVVVFAVIGVCLLLLVLGSGLVLALSNARFFVDLQPLLQRRFFFLLG